MWGDEQAAKIESVFQKDLEVLADTRRIALNVGVEESFADDLEGEAHHGIVQIDMLTRFPGLNELCGTAGHGASVVGYAVAMKGGLHHAALTKPEFSFAGE